jgi:hypothetical protein
MAVVAVATLTVVGTLAVVAAMAVATAYSGGYGGGNVGQQTPSGLPPLLVKYFKNGTIASCMVATWTTTTPAQHVLAQGKPPTCSNTHQHNGWQHALHEQDCPPKCHQQACSANPSPTPALQLHAHLQILNRRQRAVISYYARQLWFWTPRQSLPESQQHSLPPTRYRNDAQHNCVQQRISECTPSPAGSSCLSQSGPVQPLLTGRSKVYK